MVKGLAARLLPIIKLFWIYLNINCLPLNYALSHKLKFCIPPWSVKRKFLWNLLLKFGNFPLLSDQFSTLKARFNDLAHAYASNLVNYTEFKWRHEHCCVVNSLHHNKSLVKTKPDKGVGVVVMDYNNYVNKMMLMGDKFIIVEPDETHDRAKSIELNFWKCLLWLVKNKVLANIYEAIGLTGSIRPQLYGLPKTYNLSLCRILSMTGSVQHKLTKWLAVLV